MDDAISLILEGCRLAKELESNLPRLTNQTTLISKSLEEIIDTFMAANQKLNNVQHQAAIAYHGCQMPSFRQGEHVVEQGSQPTEPTLLQDFIQRADYSSAMELFHFQPSMVTASAMTTTTTAMLEARTTSGGIRFGSSGSLMDVASGSGRASSSTHGQRKRRDDLERITIRVPAPQIGNTEMPPDDGFTWRKYGQKDILNSRFPRSYFRCTHQKLYKCKAKKQVQRLDEDPFTFEVTYRGEHTCHMSATAPAAVPSQVPHITMTMTQPVADNPLGRLLEFSLGSSSSVQGAGAGPSSTVRYVQGRDPEYPVADMADAMFNSGSSSTNSMEFLFTTTTTTPTEDQTHDDRKN